MTGGEALVVRATKSGNAQLTNYRNSDLLTDWTTN